MMPSELINIICEDQSDKDLVHAAEVDKHWYKSLKQLLQFRHCRKRRLWTAYIHGNDLKRLYKYNTKHIAPTKGIGRDLAEFSLIYNKMTESDKNKHYTTPIPNYIINDYESWWMYYYPHNPLEALKPFSNNIKYQTCYKYGVERRIGEARYLFWIREPFIEQKYQEAISKKLKL